MNLLSDPAHRAYLWLLALVLAVVVCLAFFHHRAGVACRNSGGVLESSADAGWTCVKDR